MLALFNHVGARWGLGAAYRLMSWAPWLALAAGVAAGAYGGYTFGRAPLQLELAQAHQASAESQRQQAQASLRALHAAQQRGDQLSQRLAASERQRARLTQEKTHAIRQATVGRTCLDAAALRLLHHAPGLSVEHADRLPAPTSGAAAARALVATDTDIATWAIHAGAQHQSCRERLQALIDWHADASQGAAAPGLAATPETLQP